MGALRTAFKRLRRSPLVTAIAALSLGLGIGANLTIFHALDAMLLRPLPFRDASRLVTLWEHPTGKPEARESAAVPNVLAWKEHRTQVADVAGLNPLLHFAVTEPNRATFVEGQVVTWNLFDVLGVKPALGRGFRAEDDAVGTELVVILSHRFWQSYLQGDPNILGRTLSLDGEPFRIIGVMPENFGILSRSTDVWKTFSWTNAQKLSRTRYVYTIARLAQGATIASAQNGLGNLTRDWTVQVQPLHDALVSDVRLKLTLLMGAVGLVLLIACANVAGLSLGRAAERGTELAVRRALGASSRSLMQLFLAESVLLTAVGLVVACIIAWWLTPFLGPRVSAATRQVTVLTPSASSVAFMLLAGFLATLTCGVLPAFLASGGQTQTSVRQAETRTTGGRASRRTWRLLVVAQIAIALTLFVGAALLGRTLLHLRVLSPGFSPEGVVTFQIMLPRQLYMTSIGSNAAGIPEVAFNPRAAVLFEEISAALRQIPGVTAVSAAEWAPMMIPWVDRRTFLATGGQDMTAGESAPNAAYGVVQPGYFDALKIPVLRGRTFTDADGASAAPVAVISSTLANQYWPGRDPVGHTVTIQEFPDERPRRIIGVVGDVRHFGLTTESTPQFYTPKAQQPERYLGRRAGTRLHMTYVLRTPLAPERLDPTIRAAVARIDGLVPVYAVKSLHDYVDESMGETRTYAFLLGGMALLSLVLAAVGLYGVISYNVASRTREFGIRQALGADAPAILRLVMGDGLRLCLAGLVIGVAGSLAATRFLASYIHGVTRFDPYSYVLVIVVFIAVTIAATLFPALRATRVDPTTTMRAQL